MIQNLGNALRSSAFVLFIALLGGCANNDDGLPYGSDYTKEYYQQKAVDEVKTAQMQNDEAFDAKRTEVQDFLTSVNYKAKVVDKQPGQYTYYYAYGSAATWQFVLENKSGKRLAVCAVRGEGENDLITVGQEVNVDIDIQTFNRDAAYVELTRAH